MRWVKKGDMVVVRMDRGEDVFASLHTLHSRLNLCGAVVLSGLGQLTDVKLGYYDKERGYIYKELSGTYELLCVAGDFAVLGDSLVPHLHVVLGDRDMNVFGGHLAAAKVGATLEMFLQYVPGGLRRKRVDDMSILDLGEGIEHT